MVDDKFTIGHKCRTKQLHMITINTLEDDSEENDNSEGIAEEVAPEETLQLSMCALTREVPELRCNTMRVEGTVKRGSLSILIDSGSTHNFLDPYLAKRMGYKTITISPVFVAVASRERLVCREICQNFRWNIQGNEFQANVFMLRLGGCDMVLGMKLLATLGDIVWNF